MASDAVQRCVDAGSLQWPEVAIAADEIAAQLEQHMAVADASSAHAGDLYLAAAAGLGDRFAVSVIDKRIAMFAAQSNRTLLSRSDLDDAMQDLRIRLMTARESSPPLITTYRGTGPLDAWLRAVVLRAVLMARRKQLSNKVRPVDDSAWLELALVMDDDEAPAIPGRRRVPEIRRAFEEAVAVLPARQRVVLRQHFIDGLSSEQLGRIYDVHRVTVFRWIAEAKATVLAQMRERLALVFGATPTEVDSIVRGLARSFSISVVRVLDAAPPIR